MTRGRPELEYDCLPLSSRYVFAWSACPCKRAFMNELTTDEAWSIAAGSAGSGVEVALQIAPPRVKANTVPFGAQAGA